MNLYNEGVNLEGILTSDLPIEAKVNVLFDVLKNVLDEGAIRARTVRFKLQKYVNSTDINERIYALNVIASDGNGAKVVPTDETAQEVLDGYQGVKKLDEDGNEVVTKVQMDPIENLYKFRFDKYSPSWESNKDCNLYFINGVENWANDLLKLQGYLFLNDVLDRLGLPRTKAGQIVGWVVNGEGDGYVDFGVVDCETLENVNYNDNAFDLNFNVDGDILNKFE